MMKNKAEKKAENMKQPERITKSLKLLWDNVVHRKLPFLLEITFRLLISQ